MDVLERFVLQKYQPGLKIIITVLDLNPRSQSSTGQEVGQ